MANDILTNAATPTSITPTNPVNGTVWTSGKNAVPNPFFAAMNQETVQNIQTLMNGNIGGVLSSRNLVSGSTATIINATLDYFLQVDGVTSQQIPASLKNYEYTKNFIPIILKTEFNYMGDTNKPKTPLYIIFDSTPENITFAKTANWLGKPILGRPEPVFTYSDSTATTVTVTGDFFVNSKDEHLYKLKVSDYIMALATPSRDNFMPSPVQVIIGEWKNFRAIVNSVSIDFKGPWNVHPQTPPNATTNVVTSISDHSAAPAHAPYFFTATISLTLVSKENSVNYAEDIIKAAGKGVEISNLDIANINNATNSYMQANQDVPPLTTGAFVLGQTNSEYIFTNGTFVAKSTYQVTTNSKFKPGTGDSDRMNGDLTVITRAVSDKLSAIIKNKF